MAHGDPVVGYYRLPNGVEARDISQYLTSFGGQALQYIVRSCRIDGVFKGDRVEDLDKAIDLLRWERDRLLFEAGFGGDE